MFRCAMVIQNAVRRVLLGLQAWSLGRKFRVRIRLQETAHRTAEGTHRNALFRWSWNTTKPAGLTRCSLDPVADATTVRRPPVANEPLHHHAVALRAPNRFRTHARTSGKGIGRSYHTLNILFYCPSAPALNTKTRCE